MIWLLNVTCIVNLLNLFLIPVVLSSYSSHSLGNLWMYMLNSNTDNPHLPCSPWLQIDLTKKILFLKSMFVLVWDYLRVIVKLKTTDSSKYKIAFSFSLLRSHILISPFMFPVKQNLKKYTYWNQTAIFIVWLMLKVVLYI